MGESIEFDPSEERWEKMISRLLSLAAPKPKGRKKSPRASSKRKRANKQTRADRKKSRKRR